jgi:chemotaxis protein MotB
MSKQSEPEQINSSPSDPPQNPSAETKPGHPDPSATVQHPSKVIPPVYDRRQQSVFFIDDFAPYSTYVRTTNWSVGWSDLMMTMFILFMTMFVYQAAHKEFMINNEAEVIGGDTTGALDIAQGNTPSVPFTPIKPGIPLITSGTIKKVVPIHIEDLEGTHFLNENKENPLERIRKSFEKASPSTSAKTPPKQQPTPEEVPVETESELLTDQGIVEPQPITLEQPDTHGDDKTHRLLGTISNTITRYNLGRYASVDLLFESIIRITLSSDLFFTTGKADLTAKSLISLQKIGATIKQTPFMIDIVGHTDNQPMHSDNFPSNWELSVARASSVARFFIEETEMNPNQFVVSGFSSYRPLYPNTTTQNRAANRRIEVLISNKLPQPALASAKSNQ